MSSKHYADYGPGEALDAGLAAAPTLKPLVGPYHGTRRPATANVQQPPSGNPQSPRLHGRDEQGDSLAIAVHQARAQATIELETMASSGS